MAASDNLGQQWAAPNPVSGWVEGDRGLPHAVIDEDVAYERGAAPYRMIGLVQPSPMGGDRWQAELYRPHDYSTDHSWGSGVLEQMHDKVNERLFINTPNEDFRTEKRAKMAVAAMANRRNEGRNWKTGRGINTDKGPGYGGRPY